MVINGVAQSHRDHRTDGLAVTVEVVPGQKITKFIFLYTVPNEHIYSRLSRCSKAKGSGSRLSLVGPTKVNARKSFFSLKVPLKLKIKDN